MYSKMNCESLKATRATTSEIAILNSFGTCVCVCVILKNEWKYEEEKVSHLREIKIIMPWWGHHGWRITKNVIKEKCVKKVSTVPNAKC